MGAWQWGPVDEGGQQVALPAGRHVFCGAAGYEPARRATVWNGLVPDRFPDVIVRAHTVADVVSAVRYAAAHGHRIGVCSGGHHWAANHLRDGGVLLDVGGLDRCVIDPERRVAVVGPGTSGSKFSAELARHGLFFPTGHCEGVALGGYLLQGGYGWNGRVLGPACESVLGVDVVTADGQQRYCDPDTHADLYWAARGAGPGFFAVVTAFHLRLHPRPAVCGRGVYSYPVDAADEVFGWARTISPHVDARVELQLIVSRRPPVPGHPGPSIVVAAPVFADSEAEAQAALAILGSCPVVDQALDQTPYAPTSLAEWYAMASVDYPRGHRYAVDNMWTSASAEELLPGLRRILDTLPPPPSHLLMYNWGRSAARREALYGLEDEINLALCAIWADPADDERYRGWAETQMAAMAHLASGINLCDENLGRRPARFATAENMARLQRIRAAYDPDGRFHSWLGGAED
ncbi:FAD-binding oxidoreductase [Mycobacterium sp. pUA109]|uniref:FAD-binding oxidoreductase n=1 Tax=Mycobacterium sp. pUA109 TaxID=3238982 RepID=UPI00351B9278